MISSRIETEFNLGPHGDDIYASLLAAHEGLSDADSNRLNARLVLLLMNHIGDRRPIEDALRKARHGLAAHGDRTTQD